VSLVRRSTLPHFKPLEAYFGLVLDQGQADSGDVWSFQQILSPTYYM